MYTGRILFYDHELFPSGISVNILLALIGLAALYLLLYFQKRGDKVAQIISGYVFILHFPNAFYLFLEFKHILVKDGIADSFELPAVLVFGLLSILGLISTTVQILTAMRYMRLTGINRVLGILVMSFLAAWGACLGLMELTSIQGMFFPPAILTTSIKLFNSWKWSLLIFTSGATLAVFTICVNKFSYELSGQGEKNVRHTLR